MLIAVQMFFNIPDRKYVGFTKSVERVDTLSTWRSDEDFKVKGITL